MQQEGWQPDATTYLSILYIYDNPSDIRWVKKVQAQVVSAGLESNLPIGTALFKIYPKTGKLEDARCIFEMLGHRDAITWNLVIGRSGHADEAFRLFLEMQQEIPKPDTLIYLSILDTCASAGSLEWVKKVRSQALAKSWIRCWRGKRNGEHVW
ncbi:hypothetical protein M758_10G010000 [Ceratodon purpureus]|uniref:Pentatricopeptide repeat-containing protein n=1 Tax=Ceratodon purpureus TaxID=3225 RepID=A0A8T0GFH9_CERPU|nr:hypothetical protein KC19_10G010700 [Ceratodon purpureus]KAG0602366.1 hypothetical protein M758_10G010000 [Ceratodon purpureus]